MVKWIWRSSGNLIYRVFSMETPDNLQTNVTIKPPEKEALSTLSPYNLHTGHPANQIQAYKLKHISCP